MAIKEDVRLKQGETWSFDILFREADNVTVEDITGAVAKLQVKVTKTDTNAVLTMDLTHGITIDGSNGAVQIRLSESQSASLNVGKYVYDCKVTLATAEVVYPIEGVMTIFQAVTQ